MSGLAKADICPFGIKILTANERHSPRIGLLAIISVHSRFESLYGWSFSVLRKLKLLWPYSSLCKHVLDGKKTALDVGFEKQLISITGNPKIKGTKQ